MIDTKIRASIKKDVRLRIIIGIALSAMTLLAYRGVMQNDFIGFDDPLYVTDNYRLQQGLSPENFLWAFTTSYASNWHPLTWISLLLDRELFGMNAAGYHWTSLILHLLGGLLLFAALRRMTLSPWPSGFVAALFLIHPLHVESVAWVAERKDVLCGVFWMTGLWCYARYAEKPGLARYLSLVLSFLGCLSSKPMGVTFPFVLLLLDWWPLGRMNGAKAWIRLVAEKIPLFILSAAVSVITFFIQKGNQAMPPLAVMPLGDRLANATVAYVAYLAETFWPTKLSAFYPYHASPPLERSGFALVAILLITAITLLLRKCRPYLIFGWLWYLGTLIPVIGIVQVGSQAMADRYTYLPLVGIFIMVVWGAKDLLAGDRKKKVIAGAVSAMVLILLVVLTRNQVGYWKDTPTLFGRALQITERNYMAHQVLGEWLYKAGDWTEAEGHYREAIRVKPSFKQPYNNLGHLMMIQGKQDEAGRLLEKALKIDPNYAPALKNLGDVRMRLMRVDEALPLYRNALLHGGEDDPELLNNYGVALFFKGEKTEAIQKIREALHLKPDYPEARANLQKALDNEEIFKAKEGTGG